MELAFEKWHGCRNDFVVTWLSDEDGDLVRDSIVRQARVLCDRRAGIGADGILILWTKKRHELMADRLTIINSDGSLAKNCGNGLRCAALSVLKRHRDSMRSMSVEAAKRNAPEILPELVSLDVDGRSMHCRFMRVGPEWPHVAVDMGTPMVGDEVPWRGAVLAALREAWRRGGRKDNDYEAEVVDIGNPHLVLQTPAASRELMLELGPALQSVAGMDGLNVHIVASKDSSDRDAQRAKQDLGQELGDIFTAFVWERGAGETWACGSGAAAIAAVSLASGLSERSLWVAVDMPGGRLYAKHEEAGESVVLAGPGLPVFSGRVTI